MSTLAQILLVAGVVFAVNLLPAFGPPTWAVLVFFSLDFDLPAAPLVAAGAIAAAGGRFALASAAHRLRPRLSAARLRYLDRAEAALTRDRLRSAAGLGLFALSPVPSGQLFTAAGLMRRLPLARLTLAFFAGRLVSYSIYVGAAAAAEHSLGEIALDALTSPLGVALQVVMLALLGLVAGGVNPSRLEARLRHGSDRREDPRGPSRHPPADTPTPRCAPGPEARAR